MRKALAGLLLLAGFSAASPAMAGEPKLIGDIAGCMVKIYLSTNDKEQGTLIGTHRWWQESDNMLHFSCPLVPGVKNYLHISLEPPNDRCFLGYFGVDGAKFAASNASAVDSRPSYWKVSTKGWGRDYHTPVALKESNHYLMQVPKLYKRFPDMTVLADPIVGKGYDGKVYFSTEIILPEAKKFDFEL